jgi:HPt (histidine-containing phosphotransfer) domain-containing protein
VVRDELRGILAKASALRTHEVHTEKKDMPARDELAPLINQDILAQLIEILGQTRVDELFKQFINEADITISELTLIDTAQKVKAALPEVHRLAGSASTFGAQRLQHALGQLEAKGKAGQAEDFIEDLPTLPTILMASKSALTHAINP